VTLKRLRATIVTVDKR